MVSKESKSPKCIKKEKIIKIIEHWDKVPNGFMSTKEFLAWCRENHQTTIRGKEITPYYTYQVLDEGVLPVAWGGNILKVITVDGLRYVKIKSAVRKVKKVGRKCRSTSPVRIAHSRSTSYIEEKDPNYDPSIDLEKE